MAGKYFHIDYQTTISANPFTVLQFAPSANLPVRFRGVRVMPGGSTGATPPLIIDLATHADSANLATIAAGDYVQDEPFSETILMPKPKERDTGEPNTPARKFLGRIHQQAGPFLWVPNTPRGDLIWRPGELWSLRVVDDSAVASMPFAFEFSFEE